MKKRKEAAKAIMPKKQPFGAYMKGHYDLYLLLLPAVLYVAIFMYVPMYGVLMAFQVTARQEELWEAPLWG